MLAGPLGMHDWGDCGYALKIQLGDVGHRVLAANPADLCSHGLTQDFLDVKRTQRGFRVPEDHWKSVLIPGQNAKQKGRGLAVQTS